MSFLNRNQTSTQQTESNQQRNVNQQDVGTALNLTDVERVGDIQLTDQGAVQSAFNFAHDVSTQANNTEQRAVDTLSGAITRAGDVTRSDTADTLRRVGLPLVIVIGVVFTARAVFSKRGK